MYYFLNGSLIRWESGANVVFAANQCLPIISLISTSRIDWIGFDGKRGKQILHIGNSAIAAIGLWRPSNQQCKTTKWGEDTLILSFFSFILFLIRTYKKMCVRRASTNIKPSYCHYILSGFLGTMYSCIVCLFSVCFLRICYALCWVVASPCSSWWWPGLKCLLIRWD